MSEPKRRDADRLIRRYYEGEGENIGQEGAFPEDTMEPVSSVSPPSSDTAAPDATLSGGDVDATWSGTDDGEEAVGGSTPTPDQDVVDELGKAVGITYDDAEPLRFGDKVADRDVQRWELNPASSEGYQERLRELTESGTPTPTSPRAKQPRRAVKTKKSGGKKAQQKKH